MSDERERDAASIVAEWRAELDIHDREAQDGDRTWHFTHYIRADPETFIRSALREIDRLTAERDQARTKLAKLRSVIWSAYADLHSHLFTTVPVDAPNKMVEAYETLKAAYELSRAALESEVGE